MGQDDVTSAASNVIDFAAYRERRRAQIDSQRPPKHIQATSIALEISFEGRVARRPIEIQPAHALAVLAWCVEISVRALDLISVAN